MCTWLNEWFETWNVSGVCFIPVIQCRICLIFVVVVAVAVASFIWTHNVTFLPGFICMFDSPCALSIGIETYSQDLCLRAQDLCLHRSYARVIFQDFKFVVPFASNSTNNNKIRRNAFVSKYFVIVLLFDLTLKFHNTQSESSLINCHIKSSSLSW